MGLKPASAPLVYLHLLPPDDVSEGENRLFSLLVSLFNNAMCIFLPMFRTLFVIDVMTAIY